MTRHLISKLAQFDSFSLAECHSVFSYNETKQDLLLNSA